MAIESYTAQLERVQALIAQFEADGMSMTSHNQRELRRQNLADLYRREEYLRNKVAEEAAGGADGPIRVRGLEPY